MAKNIFPLKDGDEFTTSQCHIETVAGEIKPEHDEPVCWTIQGNWYRRSDGEPMSGASGKVTTCKYFYKMVKSGEYKL